jgi:hypothetical protein
LMRSRIFAVSFVLLTLFALSATVAFGADMFSGTWKMNIAKSTYSPGPPPKGPNTVQFKAVDNGMIVVLDSVYASGRKARMEYTVKFDGKEYPIVTNTVDGKPIPDAADFTMSIKKVDDYTVVFTEKNKGKVIGQVEVVIAKDGKTHTATQTGTNAQGQPIKNVIIGERQ